jgi:hypothetical protein
MTNDFLLLLMMMGNCWTWGLGALNEIRNLDHTPNTNKQIVEPEFTSFATNIVPKTNYKFVEFLVKYPTKPRQFV